MWTDARDEMKASRSGGTTRAPLGSFQSIRNDPSGALQRQGEALPGRGAKERQMQVLTHGLLRAELYPLLLQPSVAWAPSNSPKLVMALPPRPPPPTPPAPRPLPPGPPPPPSLPAPPRPGAPGPPRPRPRPANFSLRSSAGPYAMHVSFLRISSKMPRTRETFQAHSWQGLPGPCRSPRPGHEGI